MKKKKKEEDNEDEKDKEEEERFFDLKKNVFNFYSSVLCVITGIM